MNPRSAALITIALLVVPVAMAQSDPAFGIPAVLDSIDLISSNM